ncbi:unnamed protein product [Sphagnum balticum]
MSVGSSNDYTFTNVQSNGTSSQITMNNTLAVGLNINAVYLGVLIPNAASTSILTINAEIAALQPVYSLKTANYTLQSADKIVQFNCSSGSLTATLPSASTVTTGQPYEICRAADATPSNTLTVNTTSSQTIQGRASGSIKLQPSDFLIVFSDGSNWQIAEIQETISARYTPTGTQSFSNGALTTITTFTVKNWDTHSAFSAGVFTAPVAGRYKVSYQAAANTLVTPTAPADNFQVWINGASSAWLSSQSTSNAYYSAQLNDTFELTAGATLTFQILQTLTSGALAVGSGSIPMWIAIDKVITAGTYVPPVGVAYLRIRLIGGGGGGGGSGTVGTGGTGGNGGTTSFGSSFLSVGGGNGGSWGAVGATGGTPGSVPSSVVGFAIAGNSGGAGTDNSLANNNPGGPAGAPSTFGGAGGGGPAGGAGGGGQTATGAGSGGGGAGAPNSGNSAGAGASGAYMDVILNSNSTAWASSFVYSIGAGGTAGTAGASGPGFTGGGGAAGIIVIDEFYE